MELDFKTLLTRLDLLQAQVEELKNQLGRTARMESGSGGGGGVTAVAVTSPITNSGTSTAPNIGLGISPVLSVGVNSPVVNSGTATNPVLGLSPTINGTTAIQVAGANVNPIPVNFIINGNMDVCQRFGPGGSSVVAVSAGSPLSRRYVLDRWASVRDGTGATVTVSQQPFTIGQTAVPGEPLYFLRHAQSVAGSGGTVNYLRQYIEDVRTLAGQQITLSFWAKADAARTVNALFRQHFGTNGSPSSDVTSSSTSCNLTTSWQKFTATVTLGSVSGKTRGTDNNDALVLEFSLPLNTAMTIDVTQVQVEPGGNVTPFQKKSFIEELLLCKRYYQKSFPYTTAPAANTGASGAARAPVVVTGAGQALYGPPIRLGVTLRVTPVASQVTFYNPNVAGSSEAYNVLHGTSGTGTSGAGQLSDDNFAWNTTSPGTGWGAGTFGQIHWALDVDL